MTVAIDSNILIYATDTLRDHRQERAAEVVDRALLKGAILPLQVIGEFLNVTRRKRPENLVDAIAIAESWQAIGTAVPTTESDMIDAAWFMQRHKLQFWDAVICTVAIGAGARWLLSEDMQDGVTLNGLTILNPLTEANRTRLDEILPSLPSPPLD